MPYVRCGGLAVGIRWVVREAMESDAPAMIAFAREIFAEPGILVPATPEEFQLTVAEEEAAIRRHHARDNAIFLLAVANDGTLIGMWNCFGPERQALRHSVEFGMSVARPYRGQGVGYDLLIHGIAWAKSTGIITRMELKVYAENSTAIRLYERCGFVHEGRRRHAIFQHGRYHDDLIIALMLDYSHCSIGLLNELWMLWTN